MKQTLILLVLLLPLISFAQKPSKKKKAMPKADKENKWVKAKKKCVKKNKSIAEKKARLYLGKLQNQDIPPYSYFTPVEFLDIEPSKRRAEIYFHGCKSEAPEGPGGVIFGSTPACTFECTFSSESNRVKMQIEVSRQTEELNLVYLAHLNDA
jgi:hypothetical protein